MKKALVILLTTLLLVSLFVSCGGEPPKEEILIVFDGNGCKSGKMEPLKVFKGEKAKLPLNTYELPGSYFAGWNTKANGTGDDYFDADEVCFEENTTLHAQWQEFGEEIKFDANGGEGKMLRQWAKKGVPTELRPNRFTWKGHLFTGWNTKEDGNGHSFADKGEITTVKDVTLYAQWIMDLATMDDNTRWDENDGKVYTLSKDVTIEGRIVVTGDVSLVLPEGMTLNSNSGISLMEGNRLTIDGSGTLTAHSGKDVSAGIGSDGTRSEDGEYTNCGTLVINSGNINVTGGDFGAGIGGGDGGSGGTVIINGGTVSVEGGTTSAGIGGGFQGNGANVTITGGEVYTTGHQAIGGGTFGAEGGKITIGQTGKTIELYVFDTTTPVATYTEPTEYPGYRDVIMNVITVVQ